MVKNLFIILIVVIAFTVQSAFFIINEWETAIVLRLGEVIRTDLKPGIHFIIPIANNYHKLDKRIHTLDATPERYLTIEKKNLEVDSFVKWRINDTEKFYKTMNGSIQIANNRLGQILRSGLRDEFGQRTVSEVISGERSEIMKSITTSSNKQAEIFGIQVVDVRIKKVDFPQDINEAVYRRMEAERTREAKDLRSQGEEEAEKIRASADRQRTIVLADAYRKAEILRGEGDAKASEIYGITYKKDADFYSFYRSLNAYVNSFKDKSDVILLDPNSKFFKHLNK